MFILSILIIFFTITITSIKYIHSEQKLTFLEKNFTNSMRGIAIIIIMISHCISEVYYLTPPIKTLEKTISFCLFIFTKVSVGYFFFISGFGNFFSIKKYNNKINWLHNKVLKIYIPVVLLIIFTWIFAKICNIYEFIPHFITLIKNTLTMTIYGNLRRFWYIKIQVISYIFLYICIKIFKCNLKILTALFLIFTMSFCLLNLHPVWWYTTLCFPLGVIIAKYKNKIKNLLSKMEFAILNLIFVGVLIYLYCLYKQPIIIIFISILSCLIICYLSNILSIKCKIFDFAGQHTLELYLIHLTIIPFINYINKDYTYSNIINFILVFMISFAFSPILKLHSKNLFRTFFAK